MKKTMMKMTAAAALVMGMASMAHAASQAKIEFEGRIVQTACDVSLDDSADSSVQLGAFARDEFNDTTTIHTAHSDPIKLDLGSTSCRGANVPAGQTILLTANQQDSVPVDLKAAGLFGETAMGVGVDIKGASSDGATYPVANDYRSITPDIGLTLWANSTSGAVGPTAVTLPSYVFLKAGMRSYDTQKIESGKVHSSITFTAAYE
ncbi:fimbrial protein [Klebsiella aerogenes]|uniref:fimbrial protein n=1 Tax=Klebsiella aerogenes TaxID=548 RepID=UPI002FF501D1